jgi:proteasome accessory factor A
MTKPFLMGSETEYAVSGLRDGSVMDPDDVYELLASAIKHQRAWVHDHHGYQGLYLEHGGRLYLDYGSHPEHATPECFTPRQVALYDKAGEHLLALASEAAVLGEANLQLRIVKNNLDPVEPDFTTYGTHESYTCWVPGEEAGPQLIPHLVSRVLYAGAGGLTGHPEGIGFELSQRARHLHTVEGDDTTSHRAIFSTRIRKTTDAAEGWTRIHLIGKDSQRSPFGIYLTFATTGLLIEMINRGREVGRGLALANPVQALRAFSLDPWGRTRALLADGRNLTALEIQSLYLEECEKALQEGDLPDWAPETIGHWRETLGALARDPLRLADRLDPYCKLLIFEHEVMRSGFDWKDLREALGKLHDLRAAYSQAVVTAVLKDSDAELVPEEQESFPQARELAGLGRPGTLEKLLFATRMQALDFNYHEVGGLYDRLHDAGRMRDVIVTPAEIEAASRVPPEGGRAAARGAWIRDHRESDWRGDWQFVWQASSGQCLDLRDPFEGQQRQVRLILSGDDPWHVDVEGLLPGASLVVAESAEQS